MARQGLPKKYAKMGFKRGWRAYKAARRTPKRKSASRRRRAPSAPAKRRRRRGGGMKLNPKPGHNPRRRAPRTMKSTLNTTAKAAIVVGTGTAGAVGSAAVVNMLPVQTSQGRALAQTAMGMVAMMFAPRRMWWLRVAGAGAAYNGGVSLVKASGVPLPYLSGSDQMMLSPRRISPPGLNYNMRRKRMSGGRQVATSRQIASNPAYTAYQQGMDRLGVNKRFGAGRMGMNWRNPQGNSIGGPFVHASRDA